jgi:hypothetical protein
MHKDYELYDDVFMKYLCTKSMSSMMLCLRNEHVDHVFPQHYYDDVMSDAG